MKYISIILAIYLLLLGFMPNHGTMSCGGSSCCNTELTDECASTEKPSTDENSCPSQCASFCCNVITAISPRPIIPIEFLSIKPFVENSFHYNSPRGIPFQNIVWQPPQVS